MIDSHLHFDEFMADGTLADLLADARAAGLTGMMAMGGSPSCNARAVQMAEQESDVFAAVGWDRDMVGMAQDDEALAELANHPRVRAIGESGLDFHYHQDNKAEQIALFQRMLGLALAKEKPIVIHSREADGEMLDCLTPYCGSWGGGGAPAVLHCFTGTAESVRPLLDLGLMISFSGIVTFKSAEGIREAARIVPMDRMLIETDAPYLAPVPHRGKRNQPAWVACVADCLAEVKGVLVEEVVQCSERNARALFSL